jgi:solute carrier family 25 carnitine/acylcarnitine transporter 20/29
MSDDASEIEAASAKSQQQQTVDPIKSFLSGGFGGVSCVLVGHPFDLTKTRLQTAAPGTYTGAADVVRKTIAQDGIRGCVFLASDEPRKISSSWQNVPRYHPPTVRCHPYLCHLLLGEWWIQPWSRNTSLTGQGYDVGKRLVYAATPNRTSQTLSIGELAVAGAISAVPATLVAGPAERVKVLLQVSSVSGLQLDSSSSQST